jgi:hypothetical protein
MILVLPYGIGGRPVAMKRAVVDWSACFAPNRFLAVAGTNARAEERTAVRSVMAEILIF